MNRNTLVTKMEFHEDVLLDAVKSCDMDLIKMFIEKSDHGPDLWIKKKKAFLINVAVSEDNGLPIIMYLIQQGCDVNVKTVKGSTALHAACCGGKTEIVWCLLKAGADVNLKDSLGSTALHHSTYRLTAHNLEIVQLLCSEGIDINSVDKQGNTALFKACYGNLYPVAEFLIRSGANTSIKNFDGKTLYYKPFMMIKNSQWKPLMELLINSGAPLEFEQVKALCNSESKNFIQHLLRKCPLSLEQISSLLFLAVHNKDESLFELLLTENANPIIADKVSTESRPLIIECVIHSLYCALEALFRFPYNVNVTDMHGQTALHHGVQNNELESIKLLIKNKCSLNMRDNQGRTPLHLTVPLMHIEAAKILLKNGSDVNIQDNNKHTPVYYIVCPSHFHRSQCERLNLIEMILDAGYKVNTSGMADLIFYTLINAWNFSPPSYTIDILMLFLKAGYNISQDSSIQPIKKFLHLRLPEKTRENTSVFFNLLVTLSEKPLPLSELSCQVIRETLRTKLPSKVEALPLPKALKTYLLIENR